MKKGGCVKKCLIILFVTAGFVFASNLVINGDFEQELNVGWHQSTYGSATAINRDDYDPSDPDYEVYIYKGTETGYAKLYQIVDISNTNIDFSVYAKLIASDNHANAWAAAAVVISYMTLSDSILGETRIYRNSQGCPWVNCSTLHLIPAPNTDWNSYSFNLDDELINLPGVNPPEISKIKVALYSCTDHC